MARVFLDSCVVIYLREGTPEQRARIHERMTTALSLAVKGQGRV